MANFNPENCKKLKSTCNKISSLMEENEEGIFMLSQIMFLGELIKEFADNPIVNNSGIIINKTNYGNKS